MQILFVHFCYLTDLTLSLLLFTTKWPIMDSYDVKSDIHVYARFEIQTVSVTFEFYKQTTRIIMPE